MKRLNVSLFFLLFAYFATAQTNFHTKAVDLVAKMTLEEKASLCSGGTFWTTKAVPRLGIPAIYMTDGPHGVRKAQGSGFANSIPATCFPTASALSSSWNRSLIKEVGVALGEECQAMDIQILLGPGVNIKRSPLGGRNFEYFSEDPVLAGKLASSFIQGVQSQGVGTSMKHFAANSQEYDRMTMSSNVPEKTLHEIYLRAFEIAVREAQPWTVMCAYNKLDQTYCSENEKLLTDILKKSWSFQGIVVSDWGSVNDRAAGVKAGMHLEMPSSRGINDKKIVEAVQGRKLEVARLDEIVVNLLEIILKAKESHKENATYDAQKHHDLARKVAGECLVLLKNENNILPISDKTDKIAVIGDFAQKPRFQGSGSSQVRPTQTANLLEEWKKIAPKNTNFSFASGYEESGETSEKLINEAVEAAKKSSVAVLLVGLPEIFESEGYDRDNIDLPEGHTRLIEAVTAAQPNTVVVLMNGSAVAMPWAQKPKAIIEAWLTGQGGSGAIADVLTGKVNPSGKLSETFAKRLEDTPAFIDFPAKNGVATYGEGLFVGYRHYDKRKIEPQFPFGFGLSYTTFEYKKMGTKSKVFFENDNLEVSVTVKNTGKVAGSEVVQLYVHQQNPTLIRPINELKQFEKVALAAGEEKTITFQLNRRDFAQYNDAAHDWLITTDQYDILAGSSSRNLPLQQTVSVKAAMTFFPKLTRNSTLQDFGNNPKGVAFYKEFEAKMMKGNPNEPKGTPAEEEAKRKAGLMMMTFMKQTPMRTIVSMMDAMSSEKLDQILEEINKDTNAPPRP